jgi:putative NADH-flavin reductase
MKIFILFNILYLVNCFNICVIGSSSGLGKEIISQSLEKNINVLALTNNPDKIYYPFRGKGLDENYKSKTLINNPKLVIDNYNNNNKYLYENLIFTTGAKPFQNDYSYELTKKILSEKKHILKNIILISAFGVGETLDQSNLGIKIMNNWYLKDVYEAKNKQEDFLKNYINQNSHINLTILRPKVLSYGENIYNGKSRQNLAKEIIDNLSIKD